jgi:Flp pilus assembly protein TadB
MSMTQQTVPPQAGQSQQSKGRGILAFVVLLLAVMVAVSGISYLIDGNLGGTLVCIVVTLLLWFGYKALSRGQ